MKISVIVPVYNGEKHISKCIESVLSQKDYMDFEIVVVDDGSTDKTKEIVNTYAKLDSRIKLISIENSGANKARHKGLLNSSGEYITFMDSDDWISSDFFSKINCYIEEGLTDVLITGIIREFNKENKNKNEFEFGLLQPGIYKDKEINELMSNLIINKTKNGAQELFSIKPNLAGKFFKSDLLSEAKWDIPKEVFFGEDGIIVYSSILKAKNVIKLDEAYYHYIQHENSISHTKNSKIFCNIELIYSIYLKLFSGNIFEKELIEQLNKYIKILCGYAVNKIFNISFSNKYIFDFGILLDNKIRVILYGAGRVGQDYMEKIRNVFKY